MRLLSPSDLRFDWVIVFFEFSEEEEMLDEELDEEEELEDEAEEEESDEERLEIIFLDLTETEDDLIDLTPLTS
jgi:hypothetical protein